MGPKDLKTRQKSPSPLNQPSNALESEARGFFEKAVWAVVQAYGLNPEQMLDEVSSAAASLISRHTTIHRYNTKMCRDATKNNHFKE